MSFFIIIFLKKWIKQNFLHSFVNYIPKGDEGPNETNEAGIGVGIADKLSPHHNKNQTGHHAGRWHVFSDTGLRSSDAVLWVELSRGAWPQLVEFSGASTFLSLCLIDMSVSFNFTPPSKAQVFPITKALPLRSYFKFLNPKIRMKRWKGLIK